MPLIGIALIVILVWPLMWGLKANIATPAINHPPGARTIAGVGSSHIIVFCDKATGNLIYQEDDGGSIAVVKDGCPTS